MAGFSGHSLVIKNGPGSSRIHPAMLGRSIVFGERESKCQGHGIPFKDLLESREVFSSVKLPSTKRSFSVSSDLGCCMHPVPGHRDVGSSLSLRFQLLLVESTP